jgi:hypothetical protein
MRAVTVLTEQRLPVTSTRIRVCITQIPRGVRAKRVGIMVTTASAEHLGRAFLPQALVVSAVAHSYEEGGVGLTVLVGFKRVPSPTIGLLTVWACGRVKNAFF